MSGFECRKVRLTKVRQFIHFFLSCASVCKICCKNITTLSNSRTNEWHVYTMRARAFETMVWIEKTENTLFLHSVPSPATIIWTVLLVYYVPSSSSLISDWKNRQQQRSLLLIHNIQSGCSYWCLCCCCRLHNKMKSMLKIWTIFRWVRFRSPST